MSYLSTGRSIVFSILLLLPTLTQGQDLLEIYRMAASTDPTLNMAKMHADADKEQFGLALANVMPTLTTQGIYKTSRNVELMPNYFDQYNTALNLNQVVFSAPKFNQLQQAKLIQKRIPIDVRVAEQTLLFQVATKYFDILRASDTVLFHEQKRTAFQKQWQQTEERYQVGVVSITDVHEARAHLDAATAASIQAQNTLHEKYQILSELIGEKIDTVHPIRTKPNLAEYQLESLENYEALLHTDNPELQQADYNTKIVKKQIWEKRGEHLPTIDAFASLNYDKTAEPGSDHQHARVLGVKASLDLFQGGKTIAATRQRQALYQEEKSRYKKLYLEAMSELRQSYYAIHNRIAQIKALEQTVLSQQSALKAIRTAYEVGNRRLTDVLDAETALLAAKQSLNAAYYDLLLADLALKQSLGSLSVADLEHVNMLLS